MAFPGPCFLKDSIPIFTSSVSKSLGTIFMSNSSDYLWNYLISDAYQVTITGSTHYAFTDVGILLKHLLPFIPPKLLGFGTILPKRMVNITKSYELAFFQIYLKGDSEEKLMNLVNVFPEVIFKSKDL